MDATTRTIQGRGESVKKTLIVALFLIFLGLTGCKNTHDTIIVNNKSELIIDDIMISTPDGYFYENHEKFVVGKNKIGITIYFVTDGNEGWDNKEEVTE